MSDWQFTISTTSVKHQSTVSNNTENGKDEHQTVFGHDNTESSGEITIFDSLFLLKLANWL